MRPEVYERLYLRLVAKVVRWVEHLVEMLPNTVVALLLLILFWLLSMIAAAVTRRALLGMKADQAASRLVVGLVRVSVLGTGLFMALGLLGLDKAVTSLLAGAGIVGLALGFAFQDLAANLISGVALAVSHEHPFQAGDLVETNGFLGVVDHVDLRTTTITTLDGKSVIIPNKQVYQTILVNLSASKRRRVDIVVGVDYASNLGQVTAVTQSALESLKERRAEPPPRVYVRKFGDSSIELLAWFWIDFRGQEDLLRAQHEATLAIQTAYARAGIHIPFPIRTLELKGKGELAIKNP